MLNFWINYTVIASEFNRLRPKEMEVMTKHKKSTTGKAGESIEGN